jgi:hypothetical protein
MIVHVIHLLAEAGFPISTYRYAGFGAFFFVDFILFRRLLGIADMVSIEHDSRYKKRVIFNRPFKDIDVVFRSSSDYISEMSRDKRHIFWLDYDGPIANDQLADIETAVSMLSPGSLLVTTIDVDFDKADDINIREAKPSERARAWFNRFQEECGDFFDPTWESEDFGASAIPKRSTKVIETAILSGVNMRDGITFEPLFNFLYADGHQMLTIGGVICLKDDKRKLRGIEWDELPFVRRKLSLEPFKIDVPVLTRKERLYIDSHMPSDPEWEPEEFEIDAEAIRAYREVYRYCPLYAELLL